MDHVDFYNKWITGLVARKIKNGCWLTGLVDDRNIDGLRKVTGRRHRVSPYRSAYFASPWWLLTLALRRRSRESSFIIPRVVMASNDAGLSPVSFYDDPEYKTPS